MKPDSITKFDYLFLGALILDLFVVIAGWDWILAAGHEQLIRGGAEPEMLEILPAYTVTFMTIRFAIMFGIWMSISLFRIGFIRYILALWMVYSIYSMITGFQLLTLFFQLSGLIVLMMNLAALFFVFRPESNAWLRREI